MFFYLLRFYLFIRQTEITSSREAGRERGREAGSLWSREPDAGLDPRTWDHDLSLRQRLNPLSYPGAPGTLLLIMILEHKLA